MNDLETALYAIGLLLLLLIVGEGARRVLRWPAEHSRKLIHAGTALLVLIATRAFEDPTIPVLLALPFTFANIVAVPRRWLPSMHAISRKSWGTVTFPLSFIGLAIACWWLDPSRLIALQVAFVVMGFADPAAALAGQRWGRKSFDYGGGKKSWVGTTTFALVAWTGTLSAATMLSDLPLREVLLMAALVSAVSTVGEMLVGRGWDNLAVAGLSAAVVVGWLELGPARELMVVAVVVCLVAALLSIWLGVLQRSGALAAGVLGFVLLGFGGLRWLLPAAVFFVLASLLSKLGRRRKAGAREIADKGSRRDAGQVFANGGVAGVLALLSLLLPSPFWYWGMIGAFAAAAADTWGTEVGTFFRGATRHVLTGRRVTPGLSGGVSLGGTLGSVVGAVTVGSSVVWPEARPESVALVFALGLVTVAGVVGAFADSVVGATLQAVYEDPRTGKPTERARSEAGEHALIRGYRWVDNDAVNLICTGVGAGVAMLFAIVVV